MMGSNKHPERSKDILPLKEIKDALEHASDSDLFSEVLRRGLIVKAQQGPAPGPGDETATDRAMRFWESLRQRKLQERQRYPQERQETSDIDEAIASLNASVAKHHEYVGKLFELLRRKRIEKMRDLGIQRADTTPEFASLGSRMTKAIFDHLVIARRDALDAGARDIESIWSYFMRDAGYRFAEGMVKGDLGIPPDLWSSFIYQVIRGAAVCFVQDWLGHADINNMRDHTTLIDT